MNDAKPCVSYAFARCPPSPVTYWPLATCSMCPIAHSHPIAQHSDIADTSWAMWQRLDEAMIARCDEVWVVMLDGWQASVGIAAELSVARDRQMPIRYYDPATP